MQARTILFKLWNSPTVTTWMSFLTKSFSVTVIMPLVLNRLGTGDVNLWYLFAGVLSLQVLLDAGFGSAFVRVIAYGTVGLNDFSGLRSASVSLTSSGQFDHAFVGNIYHLMLRIYRLLAVAALLLLVTLGTWAFLRPLHESSNAHSGWLTWSFFVLTFPLILWGNVYINLLQGTQNIPLVRRWDTLFNLLASLSCILLLLVYPSVYLLVVVNQLWLMAACLRNYFLVRARYPFLKTIERDHDLTQEIRRNVVPSAIKSGVGILMSQGIIQGSGFVYAQLATPAALASYLIGLNLIQAIRNFAQAPFYSRLPELATYTGRGDLAQLKSVARRNMFRVYLIYSIGFFGATLFQEPLFRLIHANVQFPDARLWGLLGLAFLVDRYGAMHLQLYSTSNHIIWHTLNGITGVLMLGFSVLLFSLLGIYALPLSMLMAYLLCYSWYAPYKSYQFIKVSFWRFEQTAFLPFIVGLSAYVITLFI